MVCEWFHQIFYESQLSSMAKLLIANEVRIGGLGGGRLQTDLFEALPHLIRVAMVVDFEADVAGGNWVTVRFDSPLVRPPIKGCKNGVKAEQNNGKTWKE